MENKFSLQKLLIKLSCRKLWVWFEFAIITFILLLKANGHDHQWINTLMVGKIIVCVAFILGNASEKITEILANRTNINLGGR